MGAGIKRTRDRYSPEYNVDEVQRRATTEQEVKELEAGGQSAHAYLSKY